MELAWSAPIKDGGARITGYLVEKKKAGSDDWEPVNRTPLQGTTARVDGLDEDASYEFRVKAVNAAGPGDASLPTDMTKVEKKKGELCGIHCFI